jgi:hypothetical protein
VGRYSLYRRKSSELWLLHNPDHHVKVYLKNQEIVPVPCQYILSLMNFIINDQESFQTNSSIHNINTRNKHQTNSPRHNINTQNKHHFHRTNVKLSCFQKCTFYAGIKIFNCLPCSLKILKNEKAKFKVALRKYLNEHSFYPVDEFFCL